MRTELLQETIENLSNSIAVKNTVLVCSKEGDLIVQTDHGIEVDLKRVAVQVSTVLGVSSRIGTSLNLGTNIELSLSGKIGRMFVFKLNQNFCLAIIAPNDCNIAILNIVASRTIRTILAKEMI
ncbi:hypothetical protein I2494_07290 [Budviciaceae bacterium BWR-B9]|uniref:Roadblock/LAMTOR2 domain-containing protein n=1 Tax=Limnobaculum allomyrinae TaxID=2791986 RepID=A0ABS1IP84_9GAMM|nr:MULTISPECIES: hypothetical protein [Limnobaculum]MBK5143522.1 hypothetical protein [Limnobaculum allomyrinae]MBV7691410.1 hypothetical protein [Limnobaculum sp. M2-1]